ncbi:MAG: FKBP-type peptidyl-prolyl cis-trans isomerase [Proteobacteria bacterium]|nr:FKBP-type peptidyl-prolyl cis-trans isomerase [Pseudomonadota bacterium]
MKRKLSSTIGILILGYLFLAVAANAAEESVLKTQKDKINYGIGVSVLRNFKQQEIDPDLEFVIKGMMDAQSGGKLLLTEEELRSTLDAYQAELKQMHAQAMKAAAIENKQEGDAFLAANKKKEDVVTLPSGLQYKILKAGDGKKPSGNDMVECHYRGTLIKGTEFDSSYRTGKPAVFKVLGVIPGLTEALMLMPVGSKWQLFVPPELAYGIRGAGRDIGPNATLIFELELLAIK